MPKQNSAIRVRVMTAIAVAIVFFLGFLTYINRPFFDSDEGDIFSVGKCIADGMLLYTEIPSQHMPVMYYISALFSLIGVTTIVGFRLCFYGLIAAIQGAMVFIYGKEYGWVRVALYPAIYVVAIRFISMGHAILSDQFQGIGMVILFFELLQFETRKRLQPINVGIISFAIFISFGSAFVSAFAIFWIALTVIALTAREYKRRKIPFQACLAQFWTDYWRLLLGVSAPFILLILFYAVNGSVVDFFNYAYVFNREYYAPYLGGYGSSIVSGYFQGVRNIVALVANPTLTLGSIASYLLLFGTVYFLVFIQRKRSNWILTIGIALFLIGCATRGVWDFHGLSIVAVMSSMLAFSVCDYFDNHSNFHIAVAAVILSGVLLLYLRDLPNAIQTVVQDFDSQENAGALSSYEVVNIITDKNELIGNSTLTTTYILNTHTHPGYAAPACPWFWDYNAKKIMDSCRNNPLRVLIYDRNTAVWGYPIVEYAKEYDDFVSKNYTSLIDLGYPTLYIRNDCYADAIKRIEDICEEHHRYVSGHLQEEISQEKNSVCLVYVAEGSDFKSVQFPMWSEENGQDDIVWYDAVKNEDGAWTCEINLEDHQTRGIIDVHVYADGRFMTMTTIDMGT